MRGYKYQYLVNLYFDTETLPNGDFVLHLSDGGDFYANFVNPSEEFIANLLTRAKLKIELQKYDFMRLYLYLSRLQFVNRGYRL